MFLIYGYTLFQMFLNSVTTEESLLSLWDDVKEEEVRSEWVCLCTNHQEMALQFWRLVSQIAPLLMKGRKEKGKPEAISFCQELRLIPEMERCE
ncbi:hypothetical protein Hanom_Chr09g00866201 [Helianthus anomalus]